MSLARLRFNTVLALLQGVVSFVMNEDQFFENAVFRGAWNPTTTPDSLPDNMTANQVLLVSHSGFYHGTPLFAGQLVKFIDDNKPIMVLEKFIPVSFFLSLISFGMNQAGSSGGGSGSGLTSEAVTTLANAAISAALAEGGAIANVFLQVGNFINHQLGNLPGKYVAQTINNPADYAGVQLQQLVDDELVDVNDVNIVIDDATARNELRIIFAGADSSAYRIGQLWRISVQTNAAIGYLLFLSSGFGQFIPSELSPTPANSTTIYVIGYLGLDGSVPRFTLLSRTVVA